jgi:hypothetical protein
MATGLCYFSPLAAFPTVFPFVTSISYPAVIVTDITCATITCATITCATMLHVRESIASTISSAFSRALGLLGYLLFNALEATTTVVDIAVRTTITLTNILKLFVGGKTRLSIDSWFNCQCFLFANFAANDIARTSAMSIKADFICSSGVIKAPWWMITP